jgi:hypothetical protein
MHLPDFLSQISRKLILIISGFIIAIAIVFFAWQSNKYRIVKEALADAIAKKTDSLYTIRYDSIYFDEISGKASVKNIHIAPDTAVIKNKKTEDLPYVLLDIRIASLRVSGVKTDKALLGKQLIGDTILMEHADVIVYFVKPVQKYTRIEAEAHMVYDEILGNLKRLEVGHIFINNVNVKGRGFFTKEKDFDLVKGTIQLTDVLVDSARNLDTSRTLFCKQAAVEVASFVTYDNSRPELRVSSTIFSGKDKSLSFADIEVNRFTSENGDSIRLLHATNLNLKGLKTNEAVNNKDIIVDTITCKHIALYQPPVENLKISKNSRLKQPDSTGFMHVYTIDMRHLSFPTVDFLPAAGDGYRLGNIAIKINEVKADEIIKVQKYPLDYSKEVEIKCDKTSINSKDGFYNYTFKNASLNSLSKELKIGAVIIKPFLDEKAFAAKAHFQKDRYDAALTGITLMNIDMKNLLDKKIIASDLVIDNVSVKDYIDLQKPMNGKSKVGNYPAQLLKKIGFPIYISHVLLPNTFAEYREKEVLSDSTGDAKFTGSVINIDNVTNMPEKIKENNTMKITFASNALGTIPIKGGFTFFLNDASGKFTTTGHIPSFDVHLLNGLSAPMALLRLNTGIINSMDFNFTGNNFRAGGMFVMKYSNLKVELLKNDKKLNHVKKKKVTSLVANIIVKNDNPSNGNLREVHAHFDRNIQKSFFNLVWRTILEGMRKTAGISGAK